MALAVCALALGVASAGAAEPEQKSLLTNPGFEEVRTSGEARLPVGWNFTRWNNKETMQGAVEEIPGATGKMAVKLPACGPGAIGFGSAPQPITGDFRYYAVHLRIKKSEGCTATPWVFLSWSGKGAFLGKTELPVAINSLGRWDVLDAEVPRSEIPAGADRFSLVVALIGKEGAVGEVCYDDALVTTRDYSTLFKLKSAAEFGWFEDQPVKFVAADAPPEVKAVKGTVFDAEGAKIAEVTVQRDALLREGWVWKAPAPGYYEFAFESVGDGGAVTPMTRSWMQRGKGRVAMLNRDRYAAAVVQKGTWKERPVQFGLDMGTGDEQGKPGLVESELRVGAKLGFGFVRRWLTWGDDWTRKSAINPEQGVYKWESVDRFWGWTKQYGYRRNLATFWGTPKWASQHPEKTDVDLCVPQYAEYPPTDLKYFGDFVAETVRRYGGDIKDWEIWNEQHLPQSTCFWKGSPTEYAALLKTGYEAIKSVQPQSIVWLGGMAPRRYQPFYDEFLKTSGYPYFDMYSAHGSYPEIDLAHRAETAAGVKSKPWSSSEWHAILMGANEPSQTEPALSRRMMTDLFQQLKTGVDRVVLFTLINGNQETEALPFSLSIGEMGQSFGLFRHRPDFEPRHSSVVFHDFLARATNGRVRYVSEYDFGNQKAVLLDNGGVPLLAVWNEGANPGPLTPPLAKAVQAAAAAPTTWEGKPWKGTLDTVSMVYFAGVDRTALDAAKVPATALLYPWQNKSGRSARFANVCKGPLSTAPLFAKAEGPVASNAAWIGENFVFKSANDQPQPKGFSARFAAAAGESGLDLAVEVRDPVFYQGAMRGEYYKGDSLQFALDTEGSGENAATAEFGVALTPEGPVVWKYKAAFIGGDLPTDWTPEQQPVKFARAAVEKTPGGMLYKVHVDWGECYPYRFDAKKPMRFSLLINDNDGAGRVGWLEWSGGIGTSKDASLFGKLMLGAVSQAAGQNLFGEEALVQGKTAWRPWWIKEAEGAASQFNPANADKPASIKVNFPGEASTGGVQSPQVAVTPGETYHILARVRGKGKLNCHWVQFDAQKQKIANDMVTIPGKGGLPLGVEWQWVDRSITIPQGVATCSFNFLIYKESGSLELADVCLVKE